MSAAVKTPTTPGLFAAAERSTDLMIPWASGLRTNTACTMSPNARSVVYRPLPVTNLRSSRRRGDVPMEPDVIGTGTVTVGEADTTPQYPTDARPADQCQTIEAENRAASAGRPTEPAGKLSLHYRVKCLAF